MRHIIFKPFQIFLLVLEADDIALNPNYQSYSDPYKVTVTDDNGCQSESEIYFDRTTKIGIVLDSTDKTSLL